MERSDKIITSSHGKTPKSSLFDRLLLLSNLHQENIWQPRKILIYHGSN